MGRLIRYLPIATAVLIGLQDAGNPGLAQTKTQNRTTNAEESWSPISSTATAITGDIALADDQITIAKKKFTLAVRG